MYIKVNKKEGKTQGSLGQVSPGLLVVLLRRGVRKIWSGDVSRKRRGLARMYGNLRFGFYFHHFIRKLAIAAMTQRFSVCYMGYVPDAFLLSSVASA
jgi:hypothetical protein